MITKEKLNEPIEKFPEQMKNDDLMERLLLIEKRLNMSENNKNFLKEEMEQWFQY